MIHRGLVLCLLLDLSFAFADEPPALSRGPLPGDESGRIDEGERESRLRVVGRGALVVPRLVLEGVFAPVRAVVWTFGRYQLAERYQQLFYSRDGKVGLRPTLRLDSSYWLTVGAAFTHSDVFGAQEKLDLRAATGGQFRELYDARVHTGRRLGGRLRFEARARFERRPHDAFYGIGNADDAIEVRHRQELGRGTLAADIRTVRALHVRPAVAMTSIRYSLSDTGPALDTIYDPMTLGGWPGVRNVYGELELRWDTRRQFNKWDSPGFPGTGSLAGVFVGRVHQLDAGSDYSRYGFDLQHFIRLSTGPRVLAVRAHGEAVTGSRDKVAFTELPQLGGKRTLRGYPLDRFRDRVAALGSVEYMWDLSGDFDASLFVDAGRVYPSLDAIVLSGMRVGYGVGLLVHSSCCFLGELSVSSSRDGGVFFELSTDPVFDVDERMVRQ